MPVPAGKERRKLAKKNSANATKRVGKLLRDSPSLRRLVPAFAEQSYPDAVKDAVEETGLPESAVPPSVPYTASELLNSDFVP